MGRKETVNDGIRGGIQRSQTLDERRYCYICLSFRNVTVHLQQIEYDVRAPAEHENCNEIIGNVTRTYLKMCSKNVTENDDESHFDRLYFCARNYSSGTSSTAILIFVVSRWALPAIFA